jgi:hypothetical protein
MIQLTAAQIPNGAAAFFWGPTDPLKAGPGAVLSGIIEKVTDGGPSHCGYLTWRSGAPQLFESTIWKDVDGPQWNAFADRTGEYVNGGRIVVCPYLPECAPDLGAVEMEAARLIALREAGKCPYAIWHLPADLIEKEKVIRKVLDLGGVEHLSELLEKDASKTHGLVCSECLADVTGRTPYIGVTPAQAMAWPVYAPGVQVVP